MRSVSSKSSSCARVAFWLSLTLAVILPAGGGQGRPFGQAPATQQNTQAPPPDLKRDMTTMMRKRREEEARESGAYDQPSDAERRNRARARANFENLKHDTDQLTELAKALQLELSKSNENLLSLNVIDKAGKIEKLAKKIKGNAKGI